MKRLRRTLLLTLALLTIDVSGGCSGALIARVLP